MNDDREKFMSEICANCGSTKGAHHAGEDLWPYNYCPGHEGRMDWDKGPGTIFKPSGKYKDKKETLNGNTDNLGKDPKTLEEGSSNR